jgi:hypothetical protein
MIYRKNYEYFDSYTCRGLDKLRCVHLGQKLVYFCRDFNFVVLSIFKICYFLCERSIGIPIGT